MEVETAAHVSGAKALQQPEWTDQDEVGRVRDALTARPRLVRPGDVSALRALLAEVAHGQAHVVQAGDCAEDPAESAPHHVRRKVALLEELADGMEAGTGLPVVRVGRIGGQFAKPRSDSVEKVGDMVLPVYRGHLVNGPEPTVAARRPDPRRMLSCYAAADTVMAELDEYAPGPSRRVWTSHEALLLDYELPLTRELDDGRILLGSTHWPWIGERTRGPDGAHVGLLANVVNPVACKIGPHTEHHEITALCERLDPRREPGRLTLISRFGADAIASLPPLVHAVRGAGHPVIWLCDPMHGNTITGPDGRKTRLLDTMAREVEGFRQAVTSAGGIAGGLHLETTPDQVHECADDAATLADHPVGRRTTTLCDPRLNQEQALTLISVWTAVS
jgi:3-deoxy-7-phosphoheptulonate synthase